MKSHTDISTQLKLIKKIHDDAVKRVETRLIEFMGSEFTLSNESRKLIDAEQTYLQGKFLKSLTDVEQLAKDSLEGKRFYPKRLSTLNPNVKSHINHLEALMTDASRAWLIDGTVISHHIGEIKYIAGVPKEHAAIIDVIVSASSIALGAQNPWLLRADRIEDHLEMRDNVCSAYHPGLRQEFALSELAKLYPAKSVVKEVKVLTESSGTIVDSAAIETVVAFAEKQYNDGKKRKVLAVDGTWCGGYGTAREGTGFGVDAQQKERNGENVWVDRSLPAPSKANAAEFLKLFEEKIKSGTVAGFYIEPDEIGDLGIIDVDVEVLKRVKQLLARHNLPIILDCVQQLGRTGSYWGDNVMEVFSDYPLTVITTAKSASNGQPFAFVLMPKNISDCASPLSQITTNTYNGPLLRSLFVAEILQNEELQQWIRSKTKIIESVATEYGVEIGEKGLRGKYLNRAYYVGDTEQVKLAQIALLAEDGLLIGALPQSLRYQPMIFSLDTTTEHNARIIFNRVAEIKKGNISKEVLAVHKAIEGKSSGLARK